MSVLNNLYYYVEETKDPRTATWPFVSVYAFFTILFSYLYFLFVCGPRYMKDKPAYKLQTIIRCYNIFQIIVNSILVKWFLEVDIIEQTLNLCLPLTYSTDPISMKTLNAIWWTYMLKIFDLIETGFFILRKKNNQVSVLHVHHHIMTLLLAWLSIRYSPNGMATFSISLNCAVHVIMYTYYFLSSLNSTIRKMISPYKPVITIIQMVQLTAIVLCTMVSYLPNCSYPIFVSLVGTFNVTVNLYFFSDFYKKSYKSTKKQD